MLNLLCALLCMFDLGAQAQLKPDEALFRLEFKKMQGLVKQKNFRGLSGMLHFPFYTAKVEGTDGSGAPADPLSAAEFRPYQANIFNSEVMRLLPKLTEQALSEIEGNEDAYFSFLRKLTDKGSKLYEVYAEYAQPGRNSEGYFSFTFGRIKGRYQVIAYYGKWPVRY